jgi:spore coat protein JB
MKNYNDMFYQNYYNVNDITDLPNEANIQQDMINPTEALKRGNAFLNLYWPYKKDTFVFVPRNDREQLLLKIMEYCFYAHELKLYLDTHPDDTEKINLYVQYNKMAKSLTEQYEKLYAPITEKSDNLNGRPWIWEASPWPWEGV